MQKSMLPVSSYDYQRTMAIAPADCSRSWRQKQAGQAKSSALAGAVNRHEIRHNHSSVLARSLLAVGSMQESQARSAMLPESRIFGSLGSLRRGPRHCRSRSEAAPVAEALDLDLP